MEKLRFIGHLGSNGVPALPLLTRIARGAGIESAKRFDHFDERQADGLRIAAISSIYQIAPGQATPYLEYLLQHFTNWEATEMLRQWKTERDRIVPALAKELQVPEHRLQTAYILMGLSPALEEPRRLLYSALDSPKPPERGIAINWLWRLTNDVPRILPVARELLSSPQEAQSALNALEQMDTAAARTTISELKRLLNSRDSGVRDRAGRLLRKIAPEEMPPIID
jgi:HEAT repeat protein